MLTTFISNSEKTYVITYIVKDGNEKYFYADNVKDPDDTEMFFFIDVSIKDLDKLKVGAKFLNRTGYVDSPDGQRTRVIAQIEFMEE